MLIAGSLEWIQSFVHRSYQLLHDESSSCIWILCEDVIEHWPKWFASSWVYYCRFGLPLGDHVFEFNIHFDPTTGLDNRRVAFLKETNPHLEEHGGKGVFLNDFIDRLRKWGSVVFLRTQQWPRLCKGFLKLWLSDQRFRKNSDDAIK